MVTRYGQAAAGAEVSGGGEVSGRGGPAVRPAAADFPRDVCLTVSRNHAVFLLYWSWYMNIIWDPPLQMQYICYRLFVWFCFALWMIYQSNEGIPRHHKSQTKTKSAKCMLSDLWVQNFGWNFKGVLWNFTKNFEALYHKTCTFTKRWIFLVIMLSYVKISEVLMRRAPGTHVMYFR